MKVTPARVSGVRECLACAMWVCADCGWRRSKAQRGVPQTCFKCGSSEGKMTGIWHRDDSIRLSHEEDRLRRMNEDRL